MLINFFDKQTTLQMTLFGKFIEKKNITKNNSDNVNYQTNIKVNHLLTMCVIDILNITNNI